MTNIYEQMDRKRKQLMIEEYPYKSDRQLFDSAKGQGIHSNKAFNSLEEIQSFKEDAAKDDISLMKRRDFVVGEKTTPHSKTISILDSCMAPFGDEQYRNALEMADCELDLEQAIKELYIIQYNRYMMGIQYEIDVGLGNNPETEACRQGLESILKTASDIIYGKKYDIHAEHHYALTDAIMNMDIEGDVIDIDDYDYSE